MKSRLLRRPLLMLLPSLASAAPAAFADNATVAGDVVAYATLVSAGFEWRITGDDDHDCTVTLDYRRAGTLSWKGAQRLWRVENGLWRHGEDPGNLLAGSLFFLEPTTAYQVRLRLSDPDGGSAERILVVTTRDEPRAAATPRVRYVAPGTGGGAGTLTNPLKGLAAADAAASPGDVFIVQPGVYTSRFAPTRNGTPDAPIVYRGVDQATVILDGGGGTNGSSNCIDLSNRQHVIVENLTLRNCLRPVLVHNTVNVAVRGCRITPVALPTTIRGIDGDDVRDLYVADNVITMTGNWSAVGRTGTYGTGGYGIAVTGVGIVICYNTIVESWDAINVGDGDGTGPRTSNVDIYNNLVDRASDDAIQTDAVHHNIRVFRNRLMNSGSATSFQPSFGGPCYVLFNEMYNVRIDPFKYHAETAYFGAADPQETSGMLAFHNTSVSTKAGWYASGYWHHVKHRNNLLLSARSATYSLYIPNGQRGDLDYDGFNRQQSKIAKYNAIAYASLAELGAATGQERHGVELTSAALLRAPWPSHPELDWQAGYGTPATPQDFDLRPAAGSAALDRGQVLANINDGFAGTAPDLGCYERGAGVPWYGARATSGARLDAPHAGPAAIDLQLLPPQPNPSRGAVTIVLEAPRSAEVTVRIVDVQGRVVRAFAPAAQEPGRHVIRWDGKDDAGTLVSAGVYWVQAKTGAASVTSKITRVR